MKHVEIHTIGRMVQVDFCCSKCARSFSALVKREETNAKVSAALRGRVGSNLGRQLVPHTTLVCPCGKTFDVTPCRLKQKYCSTTCSNTYSDKSTPAKLTFQRGSRTLTGGTTRWLVYKTIRVQGSYELRTCKILDAWKLSGKIKDWYYSNTRVSYSWEDGVEHTYIIDFTVIDPDGVLWFLEVKGFIREHDERKWEAARQLGLRLNVWFLEDICKHEAQLET